MGIHVPDTLSFIDLHWPWLNWLGGLQGQRSVRDLFPLTSTLRFLKVKHSLCRQWFKRYQWGPNREMFYIVYCCSNITRVLWLSTSEVIIREENSTGYILIHLSRTVRAGSNSNQYKQQLKSFHGSNHDVNTPLVGIYIYIYLLGLLAKV